MSKITLMRNWLLESVSARLLVVIAVILLMTISCTRRESFPEESDDIMSAEEEVAYNGQLLAQVVFDSVDYIVPPQDLMQPFIREFGDGTVVDKVMIRKVQETREDKPGYYLVGIGIRNGSYRSMALKLDVSSDNSLYLTSNGAKYICGAASGCGFCYFTFLGNQITGCECESRAPGNYCEKIISKSNNLLKGVRLRNSRDGETRRAPKPSTINN